MGDERRNRDNEANSRNELRQVKNDLADLWEAHEQLSKETKKSAKLHLVAEGGVRSGSDGFFGAVFIMITLIGARNGKVGVEFAFRPFGNWILEQSRP